MDLRPTVLPATAAVSWCGMYLHNVADLPDHTLLDPETAYPTLVAVVLLMAYLVRPGRTAAAALHAWGWLHVVGGGILSVLPLAVWPYDPDQSLRHYAFHGVYLVCQLPLIIVTGRQVRRSSSRDRAGSVRRSRDAAEPTTPP